MINQILIRSLLFIPGNQPKMLEKALTLKPDAFVLDMEDSVPFSEKERARYCVAEYVDKISKTNIPIIPRVNSLETGLIDDDLKAVVGPSIFGISVGKVGSSEDLMIVDKKISWLESKSGIEVGKIKLLAWIETALGVVNSHQICKSSDRLVAVCFGAEDYTNDMQIPRHGSSKEKDVNDTETELDDNPAIVYPRTVIPIYSKAAGIIALDTPYFAYKDQKGLITDCQNAKRLGFEGKFAIHPEQIDTINQNFSPTKQEFDQAVREIQVYEESENLGRGSTSLEYQVIDVPVVERARKLVRRYKTITGDEG